MINSQKKQSGFIVLMGMLMLVLGASVWFGTLGTLKSDEMKIVRDQQYKEELRLIKQRMLNYAVLQPELFSAMTDEPGPGYFPCPDLNGDGVVQNVSGLNETSCGTHDPSSVDQLVVYGMVPYKFTNRNFVLIDSDLDNRVYWYAVDARFVNNSQVFTSSANNRFSGLNVSLPTEVAQNVTAGNSAPIFLDGEDQIVMVLFYAGEALADKNQTRPSSNITDYLEQPSIVEGDAVAFNSIGANPDTFNDYVIAITRGEWEAAVLARVSQDNNSDGVPDLCDEDLDGSGSFTTLDTEVNHWFNNCVAQSLAGSGILDPTQVGCVEDTSAPNDILNGQNWRSIICPVAFQ